MVWRMPNTEIEPKQLTLTVKHRAGKVIVWAYMASSGMGNLIFVENTMDKYAYVNILKENLKQSAKKLGLGRLYCFQQDNDPKYASRLGKEWLIYNVPKQLNCPAQSPDLIPIEHLWDHVERKIRQHNITSKDQLKVVIMEEWYKIDSLTTTKLVHSMHSRLNAAIAQKGGPTTY